MVAGGIIGYASMPREVFPVVSIDRVAISTVYSGVSPEEIEKNITIPIERAIKGVKGIEHLESASLEGTSLIEAELEPGHDMKRVAEDIRSRIERMETLPEEADDPLVIEIEFEAPVVMVGVSGPVRESTLREVADALEDRIEQIDGVGSVRLSGYRDREIWIEVDPERMYPLGIGIREVIQALKSRNLDLSGGRLKGKTEELLLRTVGEFRDISEVNRMVVRENRAGRHITLQDIGNARLTYENEENYGRINKERSITLNVTKSADGDAISIMEAVEEARDQLQQDLPEDVEISMTQNSAIWIQSRLRTLYFNGAIGFTLVCLTLFTFLNWRMALWTALGIPASFLGAIFLMPLLGQSINMLSLFALIVVLGMVVDDAIIVTENVYRYISMGYSPIKAAIIGTEQVVKPVLATVATTISAFVPLLMMTGILGKFMRVIPIVVSLVLVMSLLEALVILPSHLADFSRPLPTKSLPSDHDGRWFIRFRRLYQKTLVITLRKRYWLVAGVVALTATLLTTAYQSGKFVLFGVKDIPGFVIMLETPTGTKLEETSRRVAEIEQRVATLRAEDINASVSLIGRQLDPETNRIKTGSHLGQVYVELADFDTPDRRNGYEVLSEMREKIVGITGLKSLKVEAIQGGPPVGAAVEMKIRGEDLGQLQKISDEVLYFLEGIPGVRDIRDDYARGKKEIQFQVDPERAALYGLDTAAVAAAVRASFHGETVTRIRRDDETIDIVVKFAEPTRNNLRALDQLKVASPTGVLVPIKSVAVPKLYEGVNAINRKDHRRTVTVLADVDTDIITSREVVKKIEAEFGNLDRRVPGYDFHFGGETEEQRKSMRSLLKAFTITALIIYTILGGLFKSFLQPVIVMFAVPFGIIGVIIGHFVMGQSLGLLSLIGVVALSGIVVNDSLLLVDFINKAREKGTRRWRSIVVSGRIRMRPILLTTLTTVLGLAMLSFQTTGQAGYLAPMAISIVWGLLFATGLTLFLVPALFAIGDDLLITLKRRRSGKGSVH